MSEQRQPKADGDDGFDNRGDNRGDNRRDNHWLVRPKTIRMLWWIFGAILAATVIAQVFVHVHGYFTVDEWIGFNAIYGFLTCVAMVVFAKLLGFVLKRPVDYYDVEPRMTPNKPEHDDD